MTAGACYCPEMPEIAGPVFDAVVCRCCGSPLELTCAGQCGAEHVRASMDAVRAQLRSPAMDAKPDTIRKRETKPRTYAEKPCALCHQTFQPTGPRSVVCERCKSLKTPVTIAADPGAKDAS